MRIRSGIKSCLEVGDHTSRELLEHILVEEENHVDWLEAQLGLIAQIGEQNYLAQQLPVQFQPNGVYSLTEVANNLKGVLPQSPTLYINPENWYFVDEPQNEPESSDGAH